MNQHPDGHVFYRNIAFPKPKIVYGEGVYLFDESGKRYLDGSGGPLVANLGHNHPAVVEAVAQQVAQVGYVSAQQFTTEVLEQVSAEFASTLPLRYARLFPLSSGSEVVEAAIKLARQIQQARGQTQRHLIISRQQSYHGMTLGALAITGRPTLRTPYQMMFRDMPHIPPPYPYRNPETGRESAEHLRQAILQLGPQTVAAFLAEPISGASLGAVAPDDSYWPRIREICDELGILLIADEVLVGMGRTGRWWGGDHWQLRPDIVVASKGTAGGYIPHGFVAAEQDDIALMAQNLGDFNHGGTFSHHPVAAAAALATIQTIKREGLVEKSAELGAYLGRKLHTALDHLPYVGEVRGRGLFWGIELVQDKATKQPFPAQAKIAPQLWHNALSAGLIIYYSQGCADGVNGDVVMVGPALIVRPEQIDQIVAILAQLIGEMHPPVAAH